VKARLLEVAAMHFSPLHRELRAVDLGSGRGGDLLKWAAIEGVVDILSLDVDAERLAEAERRLDDLRRLGYIPSALNGNIFFQAQDAGVAAIPRGDGSVSIVSCHFALQRIASSAVRLRFVLMEVARVLKPGGVFVAVLPSAERVRRRLKNQSDGRSTAIGDLQIRGRGDAYEYTLLGSTDWELEHYVDEAVLIKSLLEFGFRPSSALRGSLLLSCKEFINMHGGLTSQTASRILRGALPESRDLATLSAFVVLLAVRCQRPEDSAEGSERPAGSGNPWKAREGTRETGAP
jgi:SAM-dependent methyltransferase